MINRQEIFDKAMAQIRSQGCKSILSTDTICSYRGVSDDGVPTKCAIGALIPDELYHPNLEGRSLTVFLSIFRTRVFQDLIDPQEYPHQYAGLTALFAEWSEPETADFLCDLQRVHDVGAHSQFEARAYTFAREHGLIYTPESLQ